MASTGPDPGPDDFLLERGRLLRTLAASLRDAPSRAASALIEALRLHAFVEERLCFPSLLAAGLPEARDVVAAAREALAGLSRALDQLPGPESSERSRLTAELAARVAAYTAFEQHRLVPLLAKLPAVTLREMGLEIQELVGRRGRARGA